MGGERQASSLFPGGDGRADHKPGAGRRAAKVKVSVLILAYNHERYIAQAIDGVLAQKLGCALEVIIAEDCSTDRTREIVADYARRYPDVIRPRFQNRNVGLSRNLLAGLMACTGDYIAVLDGDDYWTAEDKLQRQVNFLGLHPGFSICAHRVQKVFEDGSSPPEIYPALPRREASFDELLRAMFVQTVTAVVRADLVHPLPSWFREHGFDWPFFLLLAAKGKIHVMEDVMAVYRVHPEGLWSGGTNVRRLKLAIECMTQINEHFRHRHHSVVKGLLAYWHMEMALEAERTGDVPGFVSHRMAAMCYGMRGHTTSKHWPRIEQCVANPAVSWLLRFCGPFLLKAYRSTLGHLRGAPESQANGATTARARLSLPAARGRAARLNLDDNFGPIESASEASLRSTM
jgi:glycosyltransferase involved in cell wall biosynthesis